ncbi:hypothetical protein HDF26_001710 [Pedobacter cryoconitis]|uniref:Outer membrane protein beta-barrel domain-containing protein n=1 Tax=Pedobacter cryoconitis TaxID=188932 RepID=A0A7W8ZMS5_9SPHI|nr:hypothetical protein [Pedobacter cryoconitis]MBB5636884.1 hypothetical protein [Pedobacter cryoconitis]MBB6271283.1 hypothetical protein [Pedobacter cryoconitis]
MLRFSPLLFTELVISLLLFLINPASGQEPVDKNQSTIQPPTEPLPADKKESNAHVVFSLDSRSTIINKTHVKIYGAWTGLEFGKKHHKITLGYYWLNYGLASAGTGSNQHSSIFDLSAYTKTDVFFLSLGYWYPLVHTKKWVLSFPLELGIGKESASYFRSQDNFSQGKANTPFIPVQAGFYAEYHATPWAGVFTQIGYRNTVSSIGFRENFRGTYYSYGVTIYPGAIIALFKKKHHALP